MLPMRSRPLPTCALATIAAAGLVASASGARADSGGTTLQLGAAPGLQQSAPAISGSGVVWTSFDGQQFDIYYQDVSTGAAPINLTGTRGENEFLEDIDNGSVVYIHTGGANGSPGDIYILDTASGVASTVAGANPQVHFAHPAISGNYVVFERIVNGSVYDIDVYDRTLGGSPGPQVTNDPAVQLRPRVSGDVIVYEDYNANPSVAAVYGYRVSTSGPAFLIAGVGSWPDIDGDNVVYVGRDGAGAQQIFLYRLSTGAVRALTTAASNKSMPRISGTRVVWTDDRNGDADVFSYDLASGVEALLAGGAGLQTTGDISGNRIVYGQTDAQNNNGAVFLYTLAGITLSDVPAGCDPGKTTLADGPLRVTQSGRRAAYGSHLTNTQPGKSYFVCVENGLPDGSQRSSSVIVAADGALALMPSDFAPSSRPPHWVSAPLSFDPSLGVGPHEWDVALFSQPRTTVSVSIRVAN